ncbi:MAG: hypothetical protein M0Q91_16665 [Methanoregula sp.]|jgi:hypothetical protein|nr:hypothetical protein [Methanoregula sp.]
MNRTKKRKILVRLQIDRIVKEACRMGFIGDGSWEFSRNYRYAESGLLPGKGKNYW